MSTSWDSNSGRPQAYRRQGFICKQHAPMRLGMYIKKYIASFKSTLRNLNTTTKQLYQELSLYSTDKKVTLYCDFQREIEVVLETDRSLILQDIVCGHFPKVNINRYT